MKFEDVCLITENVPQLVEFYVEVLKTTAEGDDTHAQIKIADSGFAIYSKSAAKSDMEFDFGEYWGTGNFTLNFSVDDVDAEYSRLKALGVKFVTAPKTYPWGTRSVHFRDPDGNIITFRCMSE